jgi:hypothetical protein
MNDRGDALIVLLVVCILLAIFASALGEQQEQQESAEQAWRKKNAPEFVTGDVVVFKADGTVGTVSEVLIEKEDDKSYAHDDKPFKHTYRVTIPSIGKTVVVRGSEIRRSNNGEATDAE